MNQYWIAITLFASILAADTPPTNAGTTSIYSVMNHLSVSVGDLSGFIVALFYLAGVGLAMGGVMRLKKLGVRSAMMQADGGVVGPFVQLMIGAALVYSPTLLGVMNQTFWGSSEFESVLTWSSSYQGSQLVAIMRPLVGIIQLIGSIAFLRGWLILSRVSNGGQQQPGQVSKGVIHIVGGVLAMNITRTVTVFMNTFGLS